MTSSTFVDTNVPIYASGSAHPLKAPCLEILRIIIDNESAFVTDAEVLQEILHRYLGIRRLENGIRTLADFSEVMRGRIESIVAVDVLTAGALAPQFIRLSARDLIHLAVMRRIGVTRIVSADGGFDGVSGIERLDPARLDEWRDRVTD